MQYGAHGQDCAAAERHNRRMNAIEHQSPQDLLRAAYTPEGKREPQIIYDRIRAQTPLWRDQDSGFWYVFRWADCTEVLRSPSFGAPGLIQQSPRYATSSSLQFLADTLSNLDAPQHTRLRSQVQKSFSMPVLKRSAAYVESVIAQAIAALRDRATFDVVADYAALIPNTVICELLGVPRADHVTFGEWLQAQFRLLSPSPPTDAVLDEIDGATTSLVNYMADLIEVKRVTPGEDIISELIKQQALRDDPMSLREMIVTSTILLAGGSDTTKTAISMGTRSLLENPEQYARLVGDPSLDGSMFEEVLRTGGAVLLSNPRKALEEVQLAGETIRAGEYVVPVLVSANHDPERFTDPFRFDIARKPNLHVAFGGGMHVCVGNMLARSVGTRAIATLVRAFPHLKMLDDGRDIVMDLVALRGLKSLRVTQH
jgi:cytochrome P450 PksS